MFQKAASRLLSESFASNLRTAWRAGLRALGSGGAAFGSYAVVPLDHSAVLSKTSQEFVFGDVLDRIEAQNDFYDALIDRIREPMAVAKATIGQRKQHEREPFWKNTYFQGNDAAIAWALTGTARPQQIVEIGSGNSTKFFRHSITHHALNTRLVCVDPAPRSEISAVADEIHYLPVQQASSNVFAKLNPGDILFFDGSHLVMQGSDTQYVFLEILPRLPPGVLVHIHDINLPYEYRQFYGPRLYGEQYMLAALLVFSSNWKPVLPVYWLEKMGRLPASEHPGASFWITNDLSYVTSHLSSTR